jgi:hypothetical protein
MLPLGDSWAGLCHADSAAPQTPDLATLQPLCNIGYARGSCERFPSGEGPDAVRFTIAGDDGLDVKLYYVIERDHHPFAHGPLQYSRPAQSLSSAASGAALHRQAEAYIASYLRRKSDTHV